VAGNFDAVSRPGSELRWLDCPGDARTVGGQFASGGVVNSNLTSVAGIAVAAEHVAERRTVPSTRLGRAASALL
jgi:hypothetical protein